MQIVDLENGIGFYKRCKMSTNTTLYFLRSSEQYILNKMLPISLNPSQNIEFYGFTTKDLGVYTLVDNILAGAVWIRYKDTNKHPILNIAIKEEFRSNGLAKLMLEQLFKEAGNLFESIEVQTNKELTPFFEKFGFSHSGGSLLKTLQNTKHENIYDDYGSCKWMEP